jgi:hypothetical protein
MLAHKNRNSILIYLTELANIGFTLPLTFNFAFIFSRLSVLSDALLGRRSYDNAIIVTKIQYLF